MGTFIHRTLIYYINRYPWIRYAGRKPIAVYNGKVPNGVTVCFRSSAERVTKADIDGIILPLGTQEENSVLPKLPWNRGKLKPNVRWSAIISATGGNTGNFFKCHWLIIDPGCRGCSLTGHEILLLFIYAFAQCHCVGKSILANLYDKQGWLWWRTTVNFEHRIYLLTFRI